MNEGEIYKKIRVGGWRTTIKEEKIDCYFLFSINETSSVLFLVLVSLRVCSADACPLSICSVLQ